MSIRSRSAAVVLFFAITPGARADLDAPPTRGNWAGQTPGRFVTRRVKMVDRAGKMTEWVQRDLLVGSDEVGRERVASAKADDTGAWTEDMGVGTIGDRSTMKVIDERQDTIVIDGHTIGCVVQHLAGDTDSGAVKTERWLLTGTQVAIRSSTETTRRVDGKPVISRGTSDVTAVAQMILSTPSGEKKITVYRLSSSLTFEDGQRHDGGTWEVSSDVPGQRVSSRQWSTDDHTKPPSRESTLIDFGEDAAALAAFGKAHPPAEAFAAAEDAKRIDGLRNFIAGCEKSLASADANVRASAIRAFGKLNEPQPEAGTFAAKIPALLDDAAPEVRRAAAVVGADRGLDVGPKLPALAAADPDGMNEYLQAAVIVHTPAVMDLLLAGATDARKYVRETAARGLRASNDPRAVAAVDVLAGDADQMVRLALVDEGHMAAGAGREDIALRLSHDASQLVRTSAARVLGAADSDAARSRLVELLDNAETLDTAAYALSASRQPLPDAAKEKLLFRAKSDDPELSTTPLLVLAKAGDARILPILDGVLNDPHASDPPSRPTKGMMLPPSMTAARGLMVMAMPASLDLLLKHVNGPHAQMVISAFHDLHDPRAAAWLWKTLQSLPREQPKTRPAAGSPFERSVRQEIGTALQNSLDAPTAQAMRAALPTLDTDDARWVRSILESAERRKTLATTKPTP